MLSVMEKFLLVLAVLWVANKVIHPFDFEPVKTASQPLRIVTVPERL